MKGIIYIVGIGPGAAEMMTGEAKRALEDSDVIVGYTVYIDLVRSIYPDKRFESTPMTKEIERCRLCYELALEGNKVALVCSGDAGVYGMAAPMYALMEEYEGGGNNGDVKTGGNINSENTPPSNDDSSQVELIVIPGVTAALGGAAMLGAPINHDFCVISLSDLLTPWEVIERRLKAAIRGDFAIVLYNPASKKRRDHLRRACDIMLSEGALPERACGVVRNIGREEPSKLLCDLMTLRDTQVDMFSTVFIGNSQSEIIRDNLVTKRGYKF